VTAGVMWIGILLVLQLREIPSMPKIPDEQKPAISKVIAPAALFGSGWAAMATISWAHSGRMNGYVDSAALPRCKKSLSSAIGLGMWLGIIMWFNVWFITGPIRRRPRHGPGDPEEKTKAARVAMLTSRFKHHAVSPMLYFM